MRSIGFVDIKVQNLVQSVFLERGRKFPAQKFTQNCTSTVRTNQFILNVATPTKTKR
jgi:hypothetical protein